MNNDIEHEGSSNDYQLMIEVDGVYIPVADHLSIELIKKEGGIYQEPPYPPIGEIEYSKSGQLVGYSSITHNAQRTGGSNYTPPKKKHKKHR